MRVFESIEDVKEEMEAQGKKARKLADDLDKTMNNPGKVERKARQRALYSSAAAYEDCRKMLDEINPKLIHALRDGKVKVGFGATTGDPPRKFVGSVVEKGK